jgi:hypothetical protein
MIFWRVWVESCEAFFCDLCACAHSSDRSHDDSFNGCNRLSQYQENPMTGRTLPPEFLKFAPKRERFASDDDFLEAVGFFRHRFAVAARPIAVPAPEDPADASVPVKD